MKYRRLGKTGLMVSEIGFGADMDKSNSEKRQDSFTVSFILFIPILCIPVILFCRRLIITSAQEIPGPASGLVYALFMLVVYAAYGILLIKCIAWIIRRRRGDKWILICFVASVLAAVYLSAFFPFTSTYAQIHYSFYKSDLILAAEAAASNNLSDHYQQIGTTTYRLPNEYASFSGIMYVKKHSCSSHGYFETCNNCPSHVYFYTCRGWLGNAYLVYSSDGSPPEEVSYADRQTKQLFENWYFVLDR